MDGDYGPATQAALQSVVGTGPVPQACTSYTAGSTSYTSAQLATLANAVISDTSICSGTNQNVLAFQTAYNQVNNASLSLDGLYGPQTNAAMTAVAGSNTLSGAVPAACSNFASAPGSAASGSAITVPATTITASGGAGGAGGSFNFGPYVPWLIGAVAVAGGVGIMMYLGSHKEHMVASKHPAKHAKKHLPAHKAHKALPAHRHFAHRKLPKERTTTVVYG